MGTERLVLIALFHVALGLCPLGIGGGCHIRIGVPLDIPGCKVQLFVGDEPGFRPAQHCKPYIFALLIAVGVYKVYGGIADEVGHKEIVRAVVYLERRIVLLQYSVVYEAYPGGEGHCLHLVMGDVYEGTARLKVQALQFIAHLQTQLCIQVGKGFVHKQHGGLGRKGSCYCHALLLPPGKLRRVSVHKHAYLDYSGYPAHGQVYLFPGELALLHDGLAVPGELAGGIELHALGLCSGLPAIYNGSQLGRYIGSELRRIL